MDKFIPTEVKDLTESKQRVIRNVMDKIENPKPKYKWRYAAITVVVTMCVMLFVINEIVLIENEVENAATQLDLTEPAFTQKNGLFYFHGVTRGDSQSKVIERFGENYTMVSNVDDSGGVDTKLDYDGKVMFYFDKGKLDRILFTNVNENYFAQLYENYEGIKYSSDGNRYIFSQETNQLIKGEMIPDGSLYVYLMVPDDNLDFLENMGYQETEQPSTPIEEKKPEFKEVEGLFYLNGVTLGEPQSDVIERLGENYVIMDEEAMSSPDYVFKDQDKVQLYFRNDKLFSVAVDNVNQEYFNQLFESYEGIKFGSGQSRFIYSKETDHVIKAGIIPDGSLTLSLFYPGPDFKETKDSLDLIDKGTVDE